MPKNRITVDTSPVASNYQRYPDERIIEFDSPNGGGLLALRMREDGSLWLEPYRLDDTVRVNASAEHLVTQDGEPRIGGHYTITRSDMMNDYVEAFGHRIDLSDHTGRLGGHDIGRRVFVDLDEPQQERSDCEDSSVRSDDRAKRGRSAVTVESDNERAGRVAAFLASRERVQVRETISHGHFRNVNVVSGETVADAVNDLLRISPYPAGLAAQARENIARRLVDSSHAEHGWASYDLLIENETT